MLTLFDHVSSVRSLRDMTLDQVDIFLINLIYGPNYHVALCVQAVVLAINPISCALFSATNDLSKHWFCTEHLKFLNSKSTSQ